MRFKIIGVSVDDEGIPIETGDMDEELVEAEDTQAHKGDEDAQEEWLL